MYNKTKPIPLAQQNLQKQHNKPIHPLSKSAYEVKNNFLFEISFFEISFFVSEILTFFYYAN